MFYEEGPAVSTTGNSGDSRLSSTSVATAGPLPPSVLLRFVIVVVGLLAAYPWLTNQLAAFTHGEGVYDFSVYFAAALALRDNAHANIYDPTVLQHAAALHGAYLMPVATLYLYPPLLAILFIPLTIVSFNTAAYIWAACNIAFWLFATALLVSLFADLLGCGPELRARFLRLRTGRSRSDTGGEDRISSLSDTAVVAVALPVTLSLMSASFEESVVIGQVSLFVLFLLVLALWLDRRGRPVAAGAVLAVAALIKVFPGLLLLYYVLRGRWRAVGGFVLGLVALVVAMALYVGVDGVLATRHVFTNGTSSGQQFQNESLARVPFWLSVLAKHPLHDRWANLLGYALIAAVLAAFVAGLVWAARLARGAHGRAHLGDPGPVEYAGFAWALCTMILISPVTWEHHLAWLFPVFVVGAGLALAHGRWPATRARGRWVSATALLAMLVVGYVLVAHDLPFGYDGRVVFDPSPKLLGKIPARPFFMIQRPLGTILLWCATGYLFLRLRAGVGAPVRQPVEEAVDPERLAAGVEAGR